jgi:outer membrane murein-binding lipoprotein Lpp
MNNLAVQQSTPIQQRLMNKMGKVQKQHENEIYTTLAEFIDEEFTIFKRDMIEEFKDELIKSEGRTNTKIEDVDTRVDELNIKTEKMESKIDNFKNDDTGTFELYKATARARVHYLVGEKGSVKYILFYSPFKLKIYSDIYNYFGANNSGNIKMKGSELAINMAKSWKPNPKYIHNKLKEYRRMKDDGTLKEPRLTAYNKYLEMTNGGNNIEF